MTIKDFLKTHKKDFILKIDNGADYEYINAADYNEKKHGDYIVSGSYTDNNKMIIECDMVGLDDNGIKRNFSTWEIIKKGGR